MPRTTTTTTRDRLLDRLRRHGRLTRRELDAQAIHHRWLARLVAEGEIERVATGVYRASGAPDSADETLIDACTAVPRGVICGLTALAYHGLSTINPSRIDMAVARDRWEPVVAYPPITFHTFRDMTTGLQRVPSGHRELRIFDAERTVCDAFAMRREIGRDIALEALQTYMRRPRPNVTKLTATARTIGVYSSMRSYIEALV